MNSNNNKNNNNNNDTPRFGLRVSWRLSSRDKSSLVIILYNNWYTHMYTIMYTPLVPSINAAGHILRAQLIRVTPRESDFIAPGIF
jgi:hypothetical protein